MDRAQWINCAVCGIKHPETNWQRHPWECVAKLYRDFGEASADSMDREDGPGDLAKKLTGYIQDWCAENWQDVVRDNYRLEPYTLDELKALVAELEAKHD
jgi:hypothetical protein